MSCTLNVTLYVSSFIIVTTQNRLDRQPTVYEITVFCCAHSRLHVKLLRHVNRVYTLTLKSSLCSGGVSSWPRLKLHRDSQTDSVSTCKTMNNSQETFRGDRDNVCTAVSMQLWHQMKVVGQQFVG